MRDIMIYMMRCEVTILLVGVGGEGPASVYRRPAARHTRARPGWAGMADNNNVCKDSAAPNLTKLRLLCDTLLHEARSKGITLDDLIDIYVIKKYNELKCNRDDFKKITACANSSSAKLCHWRRWVAGAIVVVALSFMLNSQTNFLARIRNEFISSKCIIRNNYLVMEASRPRTACERVCVGVRGAAELANMSRPEFVRWAYLSRPLVVRAGAAHWPALHRFSVAFFRSLYDSIDGAYEAVMEDCQFLPFRTEYQDLRAALAMHPARAARLPGTTPWYFGW